MVLRTVCTSARWERVIVLGVRIGATARRHAPLLAIRHTASDGQLQQQQCTRANGVRETGARGRDCNEFALYMYDDAKARVEQRWGAPLPRRQ